MSEQTHSEAATPAPIRAAGTRRITLTMRAEIDKADRFTGLPRSTAKPLHILATFEQALPYLGLPALTQRLVGFLVRNTFPQDWEEGSRPIVWPSNIRLQELLCVSTQRVKGLIRQLGEAGLVVMRDHPQGKRFGRRDKQDRIIEAYGFDLSRLAQRQAEFKQIAVAAEIERKRMRELRRRSTSARRGVMQAAEELTAQLQPKNQNEQEATMTTSTFTTEGDPSEALDCLVRETAELVATARRCTHSDELEKAVKALESRKAAAEDMLRQFIKAVEMYPQGQENLPLITSTSLRANQITDTVIAQQSSSRAGAEPAPQDPSPPPPQRLFPETLRLTPIQLVELAPRLAPYMPARFNDHSWPAIVEAALWLSSEMKINRTLWAQACRVMGCEYAAVALALVSTRPAEYFTSGPGGYFAGMLRKFERGELSISRTLWKLKDQAWGNGNA